ncbi:MAG: hypothetical protein K2X87_34795 [Gemmataceae bacterium]|nr:hypothetical protein [Gemmataceae bacterium]
MSSVLKYAVPLAVLVGVVFAVTYFSRYTPTDDGPPGFVLQEKGESAPGKPLVFFTTARRWNPQSPSLPDRAFPGFFPIDPVRPQVAHFWFENRNTEPVTLQLKGVSCSACSGGRVAPLPAEATRLLLQVSAASLLPQGLTTGLAGAGMVGPAARLFSAPDALPWQGYTFSEHRGDFSQVRYTVPGAANADGWSPQWGILELNFKVGENPSLPLTADFLSRVGTTEQVGADRFSIHYRPSKPLEVDRQAIDLPELSTSAPVQTGEFVVFSPVNEGSTPPTVRVDLAPGATEEVGEWVTAGPPVRLAPAELEALAARLTEMSKEPFRVASGYRVPVVARVKVGDRPADIGRLERTVYVTDGAESREVRVKAGVRGPVYLTGEAKEVAFGTFRGAAGAAATYELTTEAPGTELAWVPGETVPKYLTVELTRQPDRGDYGRYKMRVTIPKGELAGELTGGVVVLEAKGPTRQRIRIPVTARGSR